MNNSSSVITHFLKKIGFGNMNRGMFSLVFLGYIIGSASVSIRDKWINKSGKEKETHRSQWVILTLSGFGVLIWGVWTIILQ